MDPHSLLQCFAATLEADQNIRSHAENQLRQLASTPGFLGACLDILSAPDAPSACKTAAGVYFKNRVVRYWPQENKGFDAGERPVILSRFVEVLASVDYPMKNQLVPVLRVLVAHDYPSRWPQFLPQVAELLQKKADLAALYTGVTCFAELCRHYRYVDNDQRPDLDPIIAEVFPHLMALGDEILSSEINEVSATILKLVLKCYKFVTYFDLPHVLQPRQTLVAWTEFHCRVATVPAPPYIMQSALSPAEKAQTQLAKCYKWAIANLERLFRRYASRDLSSRFKYDAFRALFVEDCIPHLMSVFLGQIERWCRGECWMPGPALYHLLEFLSQCVTQKATWAILKPFFEEIVSHFVYPLLCPTDETLEMFDADPADYINSKLDNFDDSEPDVAALGLLVTFITKRKKSTLEPILQFAYTTLSDLAKTHESLEIARKKDGALRLLGGISHVLTAPSSPFCSSMEALLADLVLPNLTSPHEFLQARTLDVCSKFSDLELQNRDTMAVLYNGILRAFTSDDEVSLPVSLQSALGIQAYMHQQLFQEILGAIILPTMSKLLALSNEIDNEIVSVVMQDCVENFAPQLQPFGVDLTKSLVEQFLRLAQEIKGAGDSGDADDFDSDFNDEIADKITAAIGLLNTMITVLLSFENSKETLVVLEDTFGPMIEYVLGNDLDDFLAEIGELIENSIFLMREVSPRSWRFLELLAHSFTNGMALMYTEELSLCLRFYMVYGAETLKQNQQLVSHLMSIILSIASEGDASAYNDISQACELAQTLNLSLQNNLCIERLCQALLPTFASNQKDSAHVKNDTLSVNQLNFITSCIMYDAPHTLGYLQEQGCLKAYFERLVAAIPQIKRVYDIKITILGLAAMCTNGTLDHVPMLVSHVGPAFAVLLKELPVAIKNFEKQRTEFDRDDFGSSQYDFDADADDYDSDGAEVPASSNTAKYLEFLEEENSKFSGSLEFDEQVFEDVLGSTPLDNLDGAAYFRDFSAALQQNNESLYQAIFGKISDSERQILANAVQPETK